MKRILVNATQSEELRVAIVDGQKLHNLDIEAGSRQRRKANVYKGRVTRVEPSLEAAFVDFGAARHGFLPLKEVARSCFKKTPDGGKTNIKDALTEGQELIVQVEKEERGNKGAALTTFVSLAGRYLVLMPNNPRAGGVSRRIDGEDRNQLREAMSQLESPKGMGAIARTAGVGRSAEELQWDLDYLMQVWDAISKAAEDKKAPFLVYQESNVIIRALRDHLRDDIGEVVIDEDETYSVAQEFMQQVMPNNLPKLKHYTETTPLFSRFQVESQIESAFQRQVNLPSGGALVIDHTEALTSIDINSARSTGGAGIEQTAHHTNLEAAEEIARQLRLRDFGGLIVIDFIDMDNNRNQHEVEQRLREAVKADRARIQIGKISRFGLLEMSRQRLRPSLGEYSAHTCPRCAGRGTIRSVESSALSVLRLIEEEATKPSTGRVIAQLPITVASFLLNEKRADIAQIEARAESEITLVPSPSLNTPNYDIQRIRTDQLHEEGNDSVSYRHQAPAEPEQAIVNAVRSVGAKPDDQPVVTRIKRAAPVIPPIPKQATFFQRLRAALQVLFNTVDNDNSNARRSSGKQKASRPSNSNRNANNRSRNNRGGSQRNNRSGQNRNKSGNRGGGNGKQQQSGNRSTGQQDNRSGQGQGNRRNNRGSSGNQNNNQNQQRSRNRRGRRGGRGRGGSGQGDQSGNQANNGQQDNKQADNQNRDNNKSRTQGDQRNTNNNNKQRGQDNRRNNGGNTGNTGQRRQDNPRNESGKTDSQAGSGAKPRPDDKTQRAGGGDGTAAKRNDNSNQTQTQQQRQPQQQTSGTPHPQDNQPQQQPQQQTSGNQKSPDKQSQQKPRRKADQSDAQTAAATEKRGNTNKPVRQPKQATGKPDANNAGLTQIETRPREPQESTES